MLAYRHAMKSGATSFSVAFKDKTQFEINCEEEMSAAKVGDWPIAQLDHEKKDIYTATSRHVYVLNFLIIINYQYADAAETDSE